MKIHCDNCEAVIKQNPARVKRHKHHFCSRRCHGEWNSKYGVHAVGWHHTSGAKTVISEASKRCWTKLKYRAKMLSVLEKGRKNPMRLLNASKGIKQAYVEGRLGTEEHRNHLSEAKLGKKRGPMPQHVKDKIGMKTKERGVFAKIWADPKLRDALVLQRMKMVGKHPNKLESYMTYILQHYFPGEWKYVGNGSVVLGGLVPDFININGKKAIIEVFGDYWHGRTERRKAEGTELESERRKVFAEFGYRVLILWETDIKSLSDKQLAEVISNFKKEVANAEGK